MSGDGCSATCQVEFGFVCTGRPSVCSSTCGDFEQASDEACDDGNTAPNDGCSANCQAVTLLHLIGVLNNCCVWLIGG